MLKRLLAALLLLAAGLPASADTCQPSAFEARWQYFSQHLITDEGRVVDYSDQRQITTSEGQSYAMLFALLAGDQPMFRRLLAWTRDNLAQGDLGAHLPAWLWGRQSEDAWGVLDANSASDSNAWIAYALLEAGRLWKQREYTVAGHLLLQRMGKEEVADLPGFGAMLLPGRQGFVHEDQWRLNPSYLPPMVMERFAQEASQPWAQVLEGTRRLLVESAPGAVSPDWVDWDGQGRRFVSRDEKDAQSSYDAIRVYLWVGMMPAGMTGAVELKAHFAPIGQWIGADGRFPERIDSRDGTALGVGPAAFSAALLPLFADGDKARALRTRAAGVPLERDNYYSQVLSLFSAGWDAGLLRFDPHGFLDSQQSPCP